MFCMVHIRHIRHIRPFSWGVVRWFAGDAVRRHQPNLLILPTKIVVQAIVLSSEIVSFSFRFAEAIVSLFWGKGKIF